LRNISLAIQIELLGDMEVDNETKIKETTRKRWQGKPEMHSRIGSEEDISLAHVYLATNPIHYSLKRSSVCTFNTHIHLHLLTFLEVTTP